MNSNSDPNSTLIGTRILKSALDTGFRIVRVLTGTAASPGIEPKTEMRPLMDPAKRAWWKAYFETPQSWKEMPL